MNQKLVSIIMPVYNCEKYVGRAIESILKQTYQNYEFIIVDDGSIDHTFSICKGYESDRVKVIFQKNGGPSKARNTGIRMSHGQYIMFLDADDEFLPDTVECMVDCIFSTNSDMVTGFYYINYNNEKNSNFHEGSSQIKIYQENEVSSFIDNMLLNKTLNVNWNKIYLSDIIKSNSLLFDENHEIGEDMRFNYSYFNYVKRGAILDKIIYIYHKDCDGLTTKYEDTKNEREIELLQFQLRYYQDHQYDLKNISLKVFKAFFYINDVEYVLNNNQYEELLNYVKKERFLCYILYFLIHFKAKKILKIILKIRKG